MDFEYSPEQLQLRKTVREFAEAELAPHVLEWDEGQIFPREAIRKIGQLGYMGSIFPEELGGAGLGYIEYAIPIEELARIDPSVALIVAAHTSLCGITSSRRAATSSGGDTCRAWLRASGSAAGRSPNRKPGRTPPAPAPARCAREMVGC